MGGGRAITTAAKVAGLGVARAGFSGGAGFSGVSPATEQLAVRGAPSRPVSATITSATYVNGGEDDVAVVQRPVWELDDWEFAGVEDDLSGGSRGERIPRVVFSAPPTLQEAKDATEDLKEAINMVYLSSSKSCSKEGSGASGSVSSILQSIQSSENKTVQSVASPVPKVAMQAFAFLSESSAAQSVIASIASDPKVWSAVMENKDLIGFLESNQTGAVPLLDKAYLKVEQCESSDSIESEAADEKDNEPWRFLEDVKLKVVQLVRNVSTFIGGLFGSTSNEENQFTADGNNKTKPSFFNDSRSLFGLAVLVIFVVVLKRA